MPNSVRARSGRNDILLDGRKFSGNAFRYMRGVGLHHGTLMVDTDVDPMMRYLTVADSKLKSRAIKSVKSRVINLREAKHGLTIAELMDAVGNSFVEQYGQGRAVIKKTVDKFHGDEKLAELEARLFSSQGQQRSIVLSLKIAELMLLTEMTGETPILLLDDVMSELDQSRRSKLMEVIQGHQVFLTCTDTAQIFPSDQILISENIDAAVESGGEDNRSTERDDQTQRDGWTSTIFYYEVVKGTVKPEDRYQAE
jgi:uncharacterized protein YhaN